MHLVLSAMSNSEEEGVFANMLAQFLERAGNARAQLNNRSLEVTFWHAFGFS